jgi:hypothetical protein
MLLLIIILILLFGGGAGYWGHSRYEGVWGGPGIGLGTILVLFLILYLLGVIPPFRR